MGGPLLPGSLNGQQMAPVQRVPFGDDGGEPDGHRTPFGGGFNSKWMGGFIKSKRMRAGTFSVPLGDRNFQMLQSRDGAFPPHRG